MRKFTGASLRNPTLWLLAATLMLVAACRIPFLPRLEIDHFPETGEQLETMEVRGIVYARVLNPRADDSSETPATVWVPMPVYLAGNYQPYSPPLANPASTTMVATSEPAATSAGGAAIGSSGNNPLEEELKSPQQPAKISFLRRRALLFPTRTATLRPELVTRLELELEEELPLRVYSDTAPDLQDAAGRRHHPGEIRQAIADWLENTTEPVDFQFILYLYSRPSSNGQLYVCALVDAQNAEPLASFTFPESRAGRLPARLVPGEALPLRNLVSSASWWCRIYSRPDDDLYRLRAGHRSGLDYGQRLKVFTRADLIKDSGQSLGFRFSRPLGEITVVEFFGDDGALGQAVPALTGTFTQAFAVAGEAEARGKVFSKTTAEEKP